MWEQLWHLPLCRLSWQGCKEQICLLHMKLLFILKHDLRLSSVCIMLHNSSLLLVWTVPISQTIYCHAFFSLKKKKYLCCFWWYFAVVIVSFSSVFEPSWTIFCSFLISLHTLMFVYIFVSHNFTYLLYCISEVPPYMKYLIVRNLTFYFSKYFLNTSTVGHDPELVLSAPCIQNL
jgi:hypothetical protein